jgi:Family of unknown function (DUF6789)
MVSSVIRPHGVTQPLGQSRATPRHGARGRLLDLLMCAAYFAIGFAPITALAVSLMGWLSLSASAWVVVAPAAGLGLLLGACFPRYGALALKGFGVGIIAVALYDCTRAPFILLGIWGDFIPNIGKWLLDSAQPNWLVGYLYRYLGDGGGMGMAFTVAYSLLRPHIRCWLAAIGYGVAIWGCLMLTLVLAPHGQELMFQLTPVSFALSLLGHVAYGATIGGVLTRMDNHAARKGAVPFTYA